MKNRLKRTRISLTLIADNSPVFIDTSNYLIIQNPETDPKRTINLSRVFKRTAEEPKKKKSQKSIWHSLTKVAHQYIPRKESKIKRIKEIREDLKASLQRQFEAQTYLRFAE